MVPTNESYRQGRAEYLADVVPGDETAIGDFDVPAHADPQAVKQILPALLIQVSQSYVHWA